MMKLLKKIKNWLFGQKEEQEKQEKVVQESKREVVGRRSHYQKPCQVTSSYRSIEEINDEIAEQKRILNKLKEEKKYQSRSEFKIWSDNVRQYDKLRGLCVSIE